MQPVANKSGHSSRVLRLTAKAFVLLSGLSIMSAGLWAQPPASASWPPPRHFDYNYAHEARRAAEFDLDHLDAGTLRDIFAERRRRVLQAIPGGAMLIFSVERAQPRRLEFQVPNSENHDFMYLTGLEGLDSYDSALLLLPSAEKNWIVLYTSGDPAEMKQATGIEEVKPLAKLEEDLSVALTDYRDWRITQIRRWPLPAALAKAWGRDHKVLYVNYPRFLRLGMPEPPRLEFFERMRRFSSELEMRDSADILDPVRMLHDAYDLACIRRAVQITGEGIVEGLRAAKPGRTETQIMEIMDFVYRYRGATLGFPTEVQETPLPPAPPAKEIPEGFIDFVPRSQAVFIRPGGVVHVDTGASFRDHSADIQRHVPVDGQFTDEQRRLYEIALNVQKTVISRIKPGVYWWELHNLAVQMLRDAGGYDKYYTYGIGHFIGMEVHDEGDYEQPLQPGMAMAIEQGVMPPGGTRIAFEDDVIVTDTGHDWISQNIPMELSDVEHMAREKSRFESFAGKEPLSLAPEGP